MSIEEIRQRDANAIPRMGKPDEDPLLRAEMDRRELLKYVDSIDIPELEFSFTADELRRLADYLDALNKAEEVAQTLRSRDGIHASMIYNEYTYDDRVERDDYLFPVILQDRLMGQIGIGESGDVSLYIRSVPFGGDK